MPTKKITVEQFRMGDRVWFVSKCGTRVTGFVWKIDTSTIHIYSRKTGSHWEVSPGLLNKSKQNSVNHG